MSLGLMDKIRELFAEDESWKRKEPVEYRGKMYGAWIPEDDKRSAWPNAKCAKCGGIMLKKQLYWNKESDTWCHPGCLKD